MSDDELVRLRAENLLLTTENKHLRFTAVPIEKWREQRQALETSLLLERQRAQLIIKRVLFGHPVSRDLYLRDGRPDEPAMAQEAASLAPVVPPGRSNDDLAKQYVRTLLQDAADLIRAGHWPDREWAAKALQWLSQPGIPGEADARRPHVDG